MSGGRFKRVPSFLNISITCSCSLYLGELRRSFETDDEVGQYQASVLLLKKVTFTRTRSGNMATVRKSLFGQKHLRCDTGLGSILGFRDQTSHSNWNCLVFVTGDVIKRTQLTWQQ